MYYYTASSSDVQTRVRVDGELSSLLNFQPPVRFTSVDLGPLQSQLGLVS